MRPPLLLYWSKAKPAIEDALVVQDRKGETRGGKARAVAQSAQTSEPAPGLIHGENGSRSNKQSPAWSPSTPVPTSGERLGSLYFQYSRPSAPRQGISSVFFRLPATVLPHGRHPGASQTATTRLSGNVANSAGLPLLTTQAFGASRCGFAGSESHSARCSLFRNGSRTGQLPRRLAST